VHTTVTPFAARKNGTATVTDAVALADPDVTVIVAVPFATEVTRPVDDTVATEVSDVAHVTQGLGIVSPSASVTVGTTVAVSPKKRPVNLRLVGASATAAET